MNIYFPIDSEEEFNSGFPRLLERLTSVTPFYEMPEFKKASQEEYYKGVQKAIQSMLEEKSLSLAKKMWSDCDTTKNRAFYRSIMESLPLVKAVFHKNKKSTTLSICTLCKSTFTREVGRFICDYFSKWLLPGRTIAVHDVYSSVVSFENLPKRGFFFHEMLVQIENNKDLATIKSNISNLINEMKINILAVSHARRVVSVNALTEEQKKIIIQENISELLDIPSKGYNHNLFEQMQHFLLKASSEERILKIKESLSPLTNLKPQLFERDLFNEMGRFILPTTENFTLNRPLAFVTRIISYSYLLRKRAAHAFISEPNERFAVTKVLRTTLNTSPIKKPVIGLLAAVNYSSDSENFDERHLLAGALALVPQASLVKNSTIHNKREYTGTRIIYLEIEKKEGVFTGKDIKTLQQSLTGEVLSRIESVTDTVFMPRNEEEVLRNILTLGNQLKFPTDLPQVMINFQTQEKKNLLFTVLLVRIENPGVPVINISTKKNRKEIWIKEKEVKTVGLIRKKTPKKAYILEICCPKKTYLRKDFSLDLTRARRDVFAYITETAGEVRDFNGGMIAKQNEVLVELKRMLLSNNFADDFFLENFFYSFTPRFMQCLLPATALKHSFGFLCEAEEHDFNKCIYFIKTITWERYIIITVSTINSSFKEFIEERITLLEFDPSSLAISYTKIHDIPTLSYILNFSDPIQSEKLLKTLVEGIKEWKAKF
ncbi:MAG: hypothetical protein SP4CHLAM5_03110 [Chlamydiia bacterium]|nr:hypothetical protein [Chlamydiia bacterium]MCH9618185.1 hypothetical protein [Chlamydiia bacterium]